MYHSLKALQLTIFTTRCFLLRIVCLIKPFICVGLVYFCTDVIITLLQIGTVILSQTVQSHCRPVWIPRTLDQQMILELLRS